MFLVVYMGGGFLLGFVIGRWWALAGPIGWAIYALNKAQEPRYAQSDIPWGAIIVIYAALASVGVIAGWLTRRLTRRFAKPS
jgi:gamma-glutamyl phosphate reductase